MVDGNTAAAQIAFACSEVAAIYPITPSSPMAETCDELASLAKTNIWGSIPSIVEMESEGGAAFRFHFDDRGNRAPDVRLRERGELVARLSHGRGRGDRIDRGHFGARERDLGGGGIAVNHDLFSHFPFPSLYLVLLN